MDEDRFLAQECAVISPGDRYGLIDVVLVLVKRSAKSAMMAKDITLGLTSSITDCLRLSRLIAFLAGVRAITLSSLSLYPPSAANSSALENLT